MKVNSFLFNPHSKNASLLKYYDDKQYIHVTLATRPNTRTTLFQSDYHLLNLNSFLNFYNQCLVLVVESTGFQSYTDKRCNIN